MTKILIVDDDLLLLGMCQDLFNVWGYEAICCANQTEAINECWNHNIDLCIIDIILPNTNGFELSREIRKTGTYCPFIFWTGHNTGLNFLRSKQTSELLILSKPVQNDLLRRIIESQISSFKSKSYLNPIAELEIRYSNSIRFIKLAETTSIGRGVTNDIRIPSVKVSSNHMMLVRMFEDSNSFYRILDGELGGRPSTNGVFVNGVKIKQYNYRDLNHGDVITIPDVYMVYRMINTDQPNVHISTQT